MAWDRERDAFKREESSGVLLFRVTVMLSCLILVPAAAIFGSAFPELVRTQLVDRLKALAGVETKSPAAPSATVAEAPAYRATAESAPGWNSAQAPPAWQPAVSPVAGPGPAANPDAAPAYRTAHQVEYTAPATAPAARRPLASAPRATAAKYEPQVRPAAHSQPKASSGDHFTEIQEKLRGYGASRYALEAVGNTDMYRFFCQFPASGDQPARDFEAIDRDPLVAMANVLKQVEGR